jgi:hypothetical protein
MDAGDKAVSILTFLLQSKEYLIGWSVFSFKFDPGNLHFVAFATGTNLAVKSISEFKGIEKYRAKLQGNVASAIATVLDKAGVKNQRVGDLKMWETLKDKINAGAEKIFAVFSIISTVSIIWGALALAIGFAAPIHVWLIFVWPLCWVFLRLNILLRIRGKLWKFRFLLFLRNIWRRDELVQIIDPPPPPSSK